ncbi:hypothetical protein [Halobellus sp. H-GB7]|uniref:hypothetical protein n=1 Tax=Halobellus sp. H-GB7 TaxID=3069756 RepID=UPI0027AF7263|nr:hypothetical protein [Halobellus sp. H-GB7]MDQ2053225.1 hypothetical protein [Halobellus sp. H-GB7]
MTDHDILIIGIENWTTGQRPDGIDNDDIRNGALVSPAGQFHQCLNTEPGGDFEVRLVKDKRDLSQYEGTWTLHFADGTTHDQESWKSAVAQAFNDGKQLVDVDGVVPVPADDVDIANSIISNGLPAQYRGDRERVQSWADENGISLPADTYEMMRTAYEEGCPDVTKTEPPEL